MNEQILVTMLFGLVLCGIAIGWFLLDRVENRLHELFSPDKIEELLPESSIRHRRITNFVHSGAYKGINDKKLYNYCRAKLFSDWVALAIFAAIMMYVLWSGAK